MRFIRTLSGPAIFVLGLLLLFTAAQLGQVWTPAHAAPAQHSQAQAKGGDAKTGADQGKSESGGKKGESAGNGSSGTGKAEGLLVAEILLLLVVGRVLGEGMQRIGQPALMGTLLAGIILGPSLFGWVWPEAQHFIFPKSEAQRGMIDGLSQIGILMLLLLTGMETDLKLVRISGGAAIAIALCGIAFPFACGSSAGPARSPPPCSAAAAPAIWRRRCSFRDRALHLLHQDRGDGGARNELHAPQSGPGSSSPTAIMEDTVGLGHVRHHLRHHRRQAVEAAADIMASMF